MFLGFGDLLGINNKYLRIRRDFWSINQLWLYDPWICFGFGDLFFRLYHGKSPFLTPPFGRIFVGFFQASLSKSKVLNVFKIILVLPMLQWKKHVMLIFIYQHDKNIVVLVVFSLMICRWMKIHWTLWSKSSRHGCPHGSLLLRNMSMKNTRRKRRHLGNNKNVWLSHFLKLVPDIPRT